MTVSREEEVFTTWTSDMAEVDASLVCLCGELDASSAPSFLADMQEVLHQRRHLVMDVNLLSYTDSTGVAAMLSIRNAVRESGGMIGLIGCHGLLSKILTAIGAGEDLPCYADLDQAIEEFVKLPL